MIAELMLAPQLFTNDVWDFPNDPFLCTKWKTFKDRNRRIKLTESGDMILFVMEKRAITESRYQVRENLWRVVPNYADWNSFFMAELHIGNGYLPSEDGLTFSYSLVRKIANQFKLGITYEPRNVFAEEAGRHIYAFAHSQDSSNK